MYLFLNIENNSLNVHDAFKRRKCNASPWIQPQMLFYEHKTCSKYHGSHLFMFYHIIQKLIVI